MSKQIQSTLAIFLIFLAFHLVDRCSVSCRCFDPYKKQNITRSYQYFIDKQFAVFSSLLAVTCDKKTNPTKNDSVVLRYHLTSTMGFQVNKGSKFNSINNDDSYIVIDLHIVFSYICFYKKMSNSTFKSVDMSSSYDLTAAYHDLNELPSQNVTKYFNSF